MRAWLNEWNYWTSKHCYCWGRGLPSTRNRFQTYVWYGMLYTAGVRRDYRETKKISWSIKESDFARLMSFPSSSRRERISMMISSCTWHILWRLSLNEGCVVGLEDVNRRGWCLVLSRRVWVIESLCLWVLFVCRGACLFFLSVSHGKWSTHWPRVVTSLVWLKNSLTY